MKIKFNGETREVRGRRLGEIIAELGAYKEGYKQGCAVAVTSEKESVELKHEFAVKTAGRSRGRGAGREARIKIVQAEGKGTGAGIKAFYENYKNFRGGGSGGEGSGEGSGVVSWKTENVTAIGPIKTNLSVQRGEQKYKKWDVFFGFGGFDPSKTYLMVSKREHEAAYGTGPDAVIGRLTRGRSIISGLQEGDRIAEITPIVTKAERAGFATSDLETEIKEGQEIFTFAKVRLFREAPMSSEHFLSLTRDGLFHADDLSHTYFASDALKGLSLPAENIHYRSKNYLSVRNAGTEKGKVFAYKESRLPHPSHNVFGEAVQGWELLDYARAGDTIYTVTEPRWMMVVGKTQKEAEAFFERENIGQVREGNVADDAVVVDLKPALTMEIAELGEVRTVGVDASGVFEVELFHKEAPKTVWYFKKITGLINRPIGILKVYFTLPGVMVLFYGSAEEAGTLVPENLAEAGEGGKGGGVKKGILGVTNMSRANRGMMGIRLTDSEEYGPTGETFNGANIVLSFSDLSPATLSFLGRLKEGDVIYVKEKG